MINEEHERRLFEDFAKKRKMSLCRRADKPHLYAFGTQAAWEGWMIRATIAHAELVRLQALVHAAGLE